MARRTSRFWVWTFPALTGLAAACLFGAGFLIAVYGSIGEPIGEPAPPPRAVPVPPRDGAFRILVLGDSLAKGTGDETGKGFALDVLDAARRKGRAEITNLAVNGLESPDVRALVETANVRALAGGADLILLSVGGNDLSHAIPRGGGSPAGIADAAADAREKFAGNLRAILRDLREANPHAPICVLGLYDPFGEDTGPGRLGASVVLQWNELIAETALSFPGVPVVPTFDLFQGRPDRLSADHYHPNRGGYAEIARRILQVAPAA
jgi:lysophospholipase L1-like esterase